MFGSFRIGVRSARRGFVMASASATRPSTFATVARASSMHRRVFSPLVPPAVWGAGARALSVSVPVLDSRPVSFSMNDVSKNLDDGTRILSDVNLSFYQGAKIGIVGHNGSGKSTLLKIIGGIDSTFEGTTRHGADLNIGYLPQEPAFEEGMTVIEAAMEGLSGKTALLDKYNAILAEYANPDVDFEELGKRQAEAEEAVEQAGAWDPEPEAHKMLEALHCPHPDSDMEMLSGGERRRVALARLLLSSPDMLLLDEPTNHLDNTSVSWLEQFLAKYPGTVLAITHDRYFLDNVAEWMLEVDGGRCYPHKGNYTSWLEGKAARTAKQDKDDDRRGKALQRELEWVRMGQRGQQKKGNARLARFKKMQEEDDDATALRKKKTNGLILPCGPRLGNTVFDVKGVTQTYEDDGRCLFKDVSFTLPPGSILGVVGKNGVGKSTLLNMITGRREVKEGKVEVGKTVAWGYVAQTRGSLNDESTIHEEIAQGVDSIQITHGGHRVPIRAYVAQFNFRGRDQSKAIKNLSGGERNRVHLAKALRAGANVLVLDEPTNDLDHDTLRALEEALPDFEGSAVVISHDRWFLDRICTHILAFEPTAGLKSKDFKIGTPESDVVFFPGTYSTYEQYKKDQHV